jgi:fermentation-respiration switch protein FrsA (DUF1100 family)
MEGAAMRRAAGRGLGRKLGRFFASALCVYIVIVVLIALGQRKLQYLPSPAAAGVPSGERYRLLEEVELTAADGVRLCAWYWPGERPLTLLVFHGNAGHRGHRLPWMERLHALGLGVFLLDYRGYGGSGGSPSEEGLYLDGEAAVAWLRARGAPGVVYVGESLGCGVAVEMAVRHPPAALIVQSGFSSAVDVARRVYPFLPVGLLMKDRYENLPKIRGLSVPLLVIHGERDEIVAPDLGRALFDAAPGPKELFIVPRAGHNDLLLAGGSAYYARVDAFLRLHAERQAPTPLEDR